MTAQVDHFELIDVKVFTPNMEKTLCPRGYQEDTIMEFLREITPTKFHLKPMEIRP